ncbi:MAG: alpha/beta hydrolase family protein [Caldilineaceae bacterium]
MPGQRDWNVRDVHWDVDGIEMHATMTMPAADGRFPALCLVAGSGPTDRNWESPLLPGNNGSGKLVAEALAQAGYVTLRYDKRASGPYVQENMAHMMGKVSMQSHVDELAGAVTTLLACSEVDPSRTFALTNSEGAIHALHYQHQAREHRFAGFVLTGMPGRSMAAVLRSQMVPQLQTLPNGDHLVQAYDDAIADIIAGRPLELDDSLPETVRNVLTAFTVPANNPFARELLGVDPAQLLRQVPEPALVLIGKKDMQVDWQADGQALEAVLAGRANVSFVYPENANHVLKYEPKDRSKLQLTEVAAGYNASDRRLDPDALAEIETWLTVHTSQTVGQASQ